MRVYLSCRMSGVPGHNYAAFDLAESQLRSLGFEVISPADIGRYYGIDEHTHADIDTVKLLLLTDLEALAYCDAVYLLPGWEQSKGVEVERLFAQYFGIFVTESISDLLVFREGTAA